KLPAQEPGSKRRRPIPYAQNANVRVDRSTGVVEATLSNDGSTAVSMGVYPNAYLPFQITPFDVAKGKARSYQWQAASHDGRYDFSIYGPDR
ncbi:DUF756 domain-containing protein, partial [Escherichia coli]|nr:DUF756 domain-containing protein [Escherichia coli]